ncbi:MAG: DUF4282 domain-containing protein [Actinomycetota bacterium]|nr:DUF4282 domain-containing protein [Actinomycetota bacterium]
MPNQSAGLLASLFDLKFDNLMMIKVVKLIYVLVLVFATVFYIGATILAFHLSSALGAATLLVLGPLGFLVYTSLWRLSFELLIAVFKISENTSKLVLVSAFTSTPGPSDRPLN